MALTNKIFLSPIAMSIGAGAYPNLAGSLLSLKVSGVIHDNHEQISEWSQNRVIKFHSARLKLLSRHLGNWVRLLEPLLFVRHLFEFFFVLLLFVLGKRSKSHVDARLLLLKSVFRDYS